MCESAVSVDTKMCTSSIQQQEATLTPQHIPMVNTYNMTFEKVQSTHFNLFHCQLEHIFIVQSFNFALVLFWYFVKMFYLISNFVFDNSNNM